jgi:hypothetical protein
MPTFANLGSPAPFQRFVDHDIDAASCLDKCLFVVTAIITFIASDRFVYRIKNRAKEAYAILGQDFVGRSAWRTCCR